jgi:hypothetical protein
MRAEVTARTMKRDDDPVSDAIGALPGIEEPVPALYVCRRARCVSGAPEYRPIARGLGLSRPANTIAQGAELLARYGRRSLAIAGTDLLGVKPGRNKRMPHSSLATRATSTARN